MVHSHGAQKNDPGDFPAADSLVDTASMYSNGYRAPDSTAGRRQGIILATKYPPPFNGKVDNFQEVLSGSLERLQRTTIDLYQVHYPVRQMPMTQLMNFMAEAVEEGKVRTVGVSNFTAEQMRGMPSWRARHSAGFEPGAVFLVTEKEIDGVLDTCELGVTLILFPAGWAPYRKI
jgi:aryl-alcohol dehydrogenase-like predicted oxidoreductase